MESSIRGLFVKFLDLWKWLVVEREYWEYQLFSYTKLWIKQFLARSCNSSVQRYEPFECFFDWFTLNIHFTVNPHKFIGTRFGKLSQEQKKEAGNRTLSLKLVGYRKSMIWSLHGQLWFFTTWETFLKLMFNLTDNFIKFKPFNVK